VTTHTGMLSVARTESFVSFLSHMSHLHTFSEETMVIGRVKGNPKEATKSF